jgi:segregation and condensation protein B
MSGKRDKWDSAKTKAVAEALLFVTEKPVKVSDILKALGDDASIPRLAVVAALEELKVEYIQSQRSFRLTEIAGGYQLRTLPEFAPYVARFLSGQERTRLSRAALETLAIVAYRQPVTRPQVEAIRGVDVGGILRMFQERGLIKIVGQSDSPGRPFLYGTTSLFLEHFGLNNLSDLPRARELAVGKPAAKDSSPEGEDEAEPRRARRDERKTSPEVVMQASSLPKTQNAERQEQDERETSTSETTSLQEEDRGA